MIKFVYAHKILEKKNTINRRKISKKEIQQYVKSKVAHFKVPRYVRFVDCFPMTITGKPQKYKMREISNKIIEENKEEI